MVRFRCADPLGVDSGDLARGAVGDGSGSAPGALGQARAAARRRCLHWRNFGGGVGARSVRCRWAGVGLFDRRAGGRDPPMSTLDVDPVAIADRSMVNDGPTDPAARSSAKVTWVAALVVDDRRHHAPPLARRRVLSCWLTKSMC